jgi:hypothetical protein
MNCHHVVDTRTQAAGYEIGAGSAADLRCPHLILPSASMHKRFMKINHYRNLYQEVWVKLTSLHQHEPGESCVLQEVLDACLLSLTRN